MEPRKGDNSSTPRLVFPFEAPVGRFPRAKQMDFCVKRTYPLTKVTKCIPDMVTPLQVDRKPIPTHKLLEDDWRAFRSALHFQAKMAAIAASQGPYTGPMFPVYESSFQPQAGHLSSRYKNCHRPRLQHMIPERRHIPISAFVGPFQSVVNVPDFYRTQRQVARSRALFRPDASVVFNTHDVPERMMIYNEPDVMPQSCVHPRFKARIFNSAMESSAVYKSVFNKKQAHTRK